MAAIVATIVIIAYLLGSIPFGLIVARSQGIDIRQHGSGNIGATNVWRVLGRKWGLLTFIADLGKGLIAVVIAKEIAIHWFIHVPLPHGHESIEHFPKDFAGIAAALGCILGHSFPVWLKFKGGKGVATSLGVIFGMMPYAALIDFALWGIVFKLSGFVSLASIVAALALPVIVFGLMCAGVIEGWGYFLFSVVAAFLVVWRHRENLKRLVAGTESSFKKKKPASDESSAVDSEPGESAEPPADTP